MPLVRTYNWDEACVLVLNRPDKGNALSSSLLRELSGALDQVLTGQATKALALVGEGDRFFCTGADLSELSQEGFDVIAFSKLFWGILERLQNAPCLTAAFVNGDCVGGGLGLALSTDFVLAKDSARFGTPELSRGLFPFMISQPMKQKLGPHRTAALALGSRLLSATESQVFGIASEIVGARDFEARAKALCHSWSQADAVTLQEGVRCLRRADMTEAELLSAFEKSVERRRKK